jgi:hypothetical protein
MPVSYPTRRSVICSAVASASLGIAGCTSNNNERTGKFRIDNRSDRPRTVRITVSSLVPGTETASKTPTADANPEIRLEERYEVEPKSSVHITNLNQSEDSGWVRTVAEMGDQRIERWVSIPTRFMWTSDIAADGALTWRSSGIE